MHHHRSGLPGNIRKGRATGNSVAGGTERTLEEGLWRQTLVESSPSLKALNSHFSTSPSAFLKK